MTGGRRENVIVAAEVGPSRVPMAGEMDEPLPISVVIPAFDAEATLADAIATARAQTRPPAEIVVVDDGSRDGTAAVARACGATVVSQANAGAAAARNAGMRAATQPWIALLDADDRWHPEKLATQWAALERTGDGLGATEFAFVHPDGRRDGGGVAGNRGFAFARPVEVSPGVARLARADLARALPVGMFLLPSSIVVRRALVADGDVYFLERAQIGSDRDAYVPEDTEWFLRLLRSTDVTLCTRELVDYRTAHGESLSASGGRMRYGDARLGERVCADPGRYADGSADAMRALRPARLREATREFARATDFERASVVARVAFRERRTPGNGAVLVAMTVLRTPVARAAAAAVRRAWRDGIKPLVARVRRR